MGGGTTVEPGVLGCYVLPGGTSTPRKGIEEARTAEAIGLGAVWIAERYDTKDLPSLAGALTQATTQVRIGAAVTHPVLRHPMVLASMGQTMQALSDGRFVLGLGRSAAWRWQAYGAASPTTAVLADTADILRRLWNGETVSYSGPAGQFPRLRLEQRAAVAPPPLLLAAVGPKTLACAGRHFDGVILHPFLTPDGARRSIEIARQSALAAGRDPAELECLATVVVAPDSDPDDEGLIVLARAAGYLQVQGLGDALASANGWDPDALARFRAQPLLSGLGDRPASKALNEETLRVVGRALPERWLSSSSAVGPASWCVTRLREYLDAGADGVILHGSTAGRLGDLARHFAAMPAP
jgi:5,10-methylenetetrahydromethanopterin reductase